MAHRVVMPKFISDAMIEVAREMLPSGLELIVAPFGSPEFKSAIKDADFYIGSSQYDHGPAFYEGAPRIRLTQLLSAGYDRFDLDAARKARVPIANNGGANSVAVAEHAMLLMLAVYRQLVSMHNNVVAGRWRGEGMASTELYELEGKTLGIVGLGSIGKKVARRAAGFGMNIRYYDVLRITEDAEDALGVKFALYPELLRVSDVVSLHVPLNAETRHMIGAPELKLMKKTAIVINTCRGPVIDEDALYDALSSKQILAAGLDVMVDEPPAKDHKMFGLPNVTLTPHSAGPTLDNIPKRLRNALDNIARMARGEAPLWVIPELRDLRN